MVIESLELKRGLELACRSEAAVLITGETGTGKSTLAERIHRESARSTSSLVVVNLASLHEATIEATLFGHERGAFTGADRNRTGRFELAEGGTLFLDEIAELSLPLQARLLEFLQTKSFTPLGSTRERRIDVRVICATNRKLENEVRAGKFREDLYHRIRVLHLDLPALADLEGQDFSEAIHRALRSVCTKTGIEIRRLTKEVAELFECYPWPGNFRELENVLEVSVLSARNFELALEDLPRWFVAAARTAPAYRMSVDVQIREEKRNREMIASADVPLERSYRKTYREPLFTGRQKGTDFCFPEGVVSTPRMSLKRLCSINFIKTEKKY
jgi:transcriptional regulator with GAF, ATPase, and Fis domain